MDCAASFGMGPDAVLAAELAAAAVLVAVVGLPVAAAVVTEQLEQHRKPAYQDLLKSDSTRAQN